MKLKPEVKTAWVNALRSEEYVQTSHVLRSVDDGYCCLGVLCDLAVKEGYGNWTESPWSDEGVQYEGPDGITDGGIPPDSIVEWAFGSPLVERPFRVRALLGDDEESVHLADLNDQHGYSFLDIANVIEEQM